MKNKDYKKALGLEYPREEGVEGSQIELAYKYLIGDGVDRDLEKAFRILFDDAEGGCNPKAMIALAVICFTEQRDPGMTLKEGFFWIMRASDMGYVPAEYQMGRCYLLGIAASQNYELAFQWFEKAVSQGDPAAENSIGLMYCRGQAVEKDPEQGFLWVERSAKHLYGPGICNLAGFYYRGIATEQDKEFAVSLYRIAAGIENSKERASRELTKLGLGVEGEILPRAKEYLGL